jgi:hypothetical protein
MIGTIEVTIEGLFQKESHDRYINVMWKQLLPILRNHEDLSDEFWWQTAIDSPDRILDRFLVSHEFNESAAVKSLIEFLEWRRNFKIRQLIYQGETNGSIKPHIFKSKKGFFWGQDKQGNLVIYLYPSRHNLFKQTQEETQRHIVYQVELGRRLIKLSSNTMTDKVSVIIDMEGMQVPSLDILCARFVLFCLQKNYPDALGHIFVVSTSMFYGFILKAVRNIIKPAVLGKLRQVGDPKQLLEHVDKMYLLAKYQGESGYNYEYIPPKTHILSDEAEEQNSLLQVEARELTRSFYASEDMNLKSQIKAIYEKIDAILYPGDLYTRISVVKDGAVCWNRYSNKN